MMKLLLYISLLLATITLNTNGQDTKFAFSEPVDIKETGWNKVLCMKNGNTLLLHFENTKPVVLYVFDSLHKQIAAKSYPCNVFDINKLKETVFQGLFEINNEAVLFMNQELQSKHCLIRLRFSGTDGAMTEEKMIATSPAMITPTDFIVVHSKDKEEYSIVYCTDNNSFKKCDLHVVFYGNKHEQVKDLPVEVDRKTYDDLYVVGAQERNNEICITLGMTFRETNGTFNTMGNVTTEIIHSYFQALFVSKDRGNATGTQIIDLSTTVIPASTEYTYNPFANAYNIFMLSYKPIRYRNGLEWQPAAKVSNLFLKFDAGDLRISSSWLKNSMVNDYLHRNIDTGSNFLGIPLFASTNDNGLTTMIQESYSMWKDVNPSYTSMLPNRLNNTTSSNMGMMDSYLGDLAITQYDDDGKEIWGIVLPKMHCYYSHHTFYNINLLPQKNQSQRIFDDLPDEVYNRQFFTVNTYSRNRNFYMLFNDYNSNFNNTIKNPGDTVYSYESTNACYFKMDRKKEISKKHLFGEPAAGEFISCFTEGADFIEKTGMYAALVRSKKGETITLRMAWAWLD